MGIDGLGEDWTGTAAVVGSCRVPMALVLEQRLINQIMP